MLDRPGTIGRVQSITTTATGQEVNNMRTPSDIASALHEGRARLADSLARVEALSLELANSVTEKSVVSFGSFTDNEYVHYHVLITPGSGVMEYVKEAK
jgi:hypothetical protein